MKNLPQLDQAVRHGEWARFPMRELSGKTSHRLQRLPAGCT